MAKIDNEMQNLHLRFTQKNSDHGNKISENEALLLIKRADTLNNSGSSSCFKRSHAGNKQLLKLLIKHRADFSEESTGLINRYLASGQIPRLAPVRNNISLQPEGIKRNNTAIQPEGIKRNNIALQPEGIRRPSVQSERRASSSGGHPTNVPPSIPFRTSTRITPSVIANPNNENRLPRQPSITTMPINPNLGGNAPNNLTGVNVSLPHSSRRENNSNHRISTSIPNVNNTPNNVTIMGGGTAIPLPSMINPMPSAGNVNPSGNNLPPLPDRPANIPLPSVPNLPVPPSGNAVTGGVAAPINNGSAHDPSIVIAPSPVPSSGDIGRITPFGKITIDWQATKRTSSWHWFPIQERTRAGGDRLNNLYAEGGCLQKLDLVDGGKSREYELAHHRKPYGGSDEFAWWGHCNNACEAACILQPPKHDVEMIGKNGEKILFTTHDIKGLLLKVTPTLIKRVDFKGERYNTSRDDPNDPHPPLFLKTLEEWTKDGLPFAMDIDPLAQVWNFPYDQVRVMESDTSPSNYKPTNLVEGGTVKFYHIEMAGTGFQDKKRTYECYIQRDSSGKVLTDGWIKTQNTHNNPDFLWRPHPIPDIMNRANWAARSKSNPQVDPQVVYDIYAKSLI